MVRERLDHALSRVVKNQTVSEDVPIAYVNHFPGWFKIFDVQINPFHSLRTTLYFKKESEQATWLIGIESGHTQRLCLSSRAASFFCENISADGSHVRFSVFCDEFLRLEKFLHGFLLQKDHLGRLSWCICPYACVTQLAAVLNALLDYIAYSEYFSIDIPDGCPCHPLQKCLLRCCARRVLGYKIRKRGLSKYLNQINCERILRLFNTCSQFYRCSFLFHEPSDIVNHTRDTFSENIDENNEHDRRIENMLNYLFAPIYSHA